MVTIIWPTAVAAKADNVCSVSASACYIGGPNSVNLGQILLVYGTWNLILIYSIRQTVERCEGFRPSKQALKNDPSKAADRHRSFPQMIKYCMSDIRIGLLCSM